MNKFVFSDNLYLSNEQFVDFLKYLSKELNKEFAINVEFEVIQFDFPIAVKATVKRNNKIKNYDIDFYCGMFTLEVETNLDRQLYRNWQEKLIKFKKALFGDEFVNQYNNFLDYQNHQA